MKLSRVVVLLFVVLFVVCSCSRETAVTPTSPFPIPTLPPDLPIFFPRQNLVNGEWARVFGQIRGKLREENGCIRIEEYLVIWPPLYGADSENGQIRILDADGRLLALVGEEVTMIGGPDAVGSIWMNEQLPQTMPPECPAPYWFSGGSSPGLTTKALSDSIVIA